MKKRLLILLTVSCVAAAGLAAAAAPLNRAPRPGRALNPAQQFRAVARHLNLSEAQRTSLREIARLHRTEMQPLVRQARTARAALRKIATTTPLDEAALAGQSDAVAAARKDLVIATARLRSDLRSVLSDEQRAQLDARRLLARERAQQRRGALRAGRPLR